MARKKYEPRLVDVLFVEGVKRHMVFVKASGNGRRGFEMIVEGNIRDFLTGITGQAPCVAIEKAGEMRKQRIKIVSINSLGRFTP